MKQQDITTPPSLRAGPILLRGGTLICPHQNTIQRGDLYVVAGTIQPQPAKLPRNTKIVDVTGLFIAPGFIDLHTHLREPGNNDAENIESASQAAAAGGFTTIVAMPNTNPPADTPASIATIRQHPQKHVTILPTGCLTIGRAGLKVAPLAELARAGAVAFTDDGSTPASTAVMREAMIIAKRLGRPVLDHAEQGGHHGVMHAGQRAQDLHLPGIPAESETSMIERDIALAAETGCHIHIQHVSLAASVALIKKAQDKGLPVTAEVTPHHLALTEADVDPNDANYKMNPPLRTAADRDALREAVASGIITVIATDHAPHTAAQKNRGFIEAPFGIIGLETAIGLTYTILVKGGLMPPLDWVKRFTTGPAEILGLPKPSLEAGQPADLVILDLDSVWTVDPEKFYSRSRNTPFRGWELTGRAIAVCISA